MQRISSIAIAILGAGLATFAPAMADPTASAGFVSGDALHFKKPGTLDGTVSSVDYAGNTFVVDTTHGKVTVIVKPSTDFQGSPGYHSITDVTRGASVTVLSSVVGDKTFAEIVTLKAAPKAGPPR